jgi:hypothetical protein
MDFIFWNASHGILLDGTMETFYLILDKVGSHSMGFGFALLI